MRTKARIDATHREIVDALEAGGCFVQSLASVGKGCPDLLIGWRGVWFVAEVKAGTGKVNAAQRAWMERAPSSVFLLREVKDVEKFLRSAWILKYEWVAPMAAALKG